MKDIFQEFEKAFFLQKALFEDFNGPTQNLIPLPLMDNNVRKLSNLIWFN